MTVRLPAVAGVFYPDDARQLQAAVRRYLPASSAAGPPPKAIIAPHAGYQYSGPVAGSAYALLAGAGGIITRVVLAGPSHRVAFRGVAVPSALRFETPLGEIAIDQDALARLRALPQVTVLDAAHAREHSLEVHLPFLQVALGRFSLVPLVVGEASADEVGQVLEAVWGGPETVIVVSSDLSHYHDYDTARRKDAATSAAIEALRGEDISDEDACGYAPVQGLLCVARRRHLAARTLDLRNSGDTGGRRDQVVGYGAYAIG